MCSKVLRWKVINLPSCVFGPGDIPASLCNRTAGLPSESTDRTCSELFFPTHGYVQSLEKFRDRSTPTNGFHSKRTFKNIEFQDNRQNMTEQLFDRSLSFVMCFHFVEICVPFLRGSCLAWTAQRSSYRKAMILDRSSQAQDLLINLLFCLGPW